jgi:NADPH-dependent 2,4-dienoyl-CoA reductase/sulfur reductase-like enzyme
MGSPDRVIIGGGQAGLALGHHLQRAGRRFVIVEAADRLGDSWRPWQHNRGSALLGWVGRDAGVLAERLGEQLQRSRVARAAEGVAVAA